MFEYCPINEMPHELFPFQKVCLDNDAIFTWKVLFLRAIKVER